MSHLSLFQEHVKGLKKSGRENEFIGLCPLHPDTNPSFSVNIYTGLWYCFGCHKKGNVKTFLKELGVSQKPENQIEYQIQSKSNMPKEALEYIKAKHRKTISMNAVRHFNIYYSSYKNQFGDVRCLKMPTADNFDEKLEYNLPDNSGKIRWKLPSKEACPQVSNDSFIGKISKDSTIYIAEGEWDCFKLFDLGFSNTISFISGAGKYPKHHLDKFKEKKVIIAYDYDNAGKIGALKVANWLYGTAKEIRILNWEKSGLKENSKDLKDISDYIEKLDKSNEDIKKLVDNSPIYERSLNKLENRLMTEELSSKEEKCRYIIPLMSTIGEFIKYKYGSCVDYYWFNKTEKRLYLIDKNSNDIQRFLDDQFLINSTLPTFGHIIERLKTIADKEGKESFVYQFSYYDQRRNVLYVYNNNNQIYRIDGESIELVDNGMDGVLFFENNYSSFEFIKNARHKKLLEEFIFNKINFEYEHHSFALSSDDQKVLFRNWFYSLFFESILPTKPILILKGEKGSGKTWILKAVLLLLFGKGKTVDSMPDQIKDFVSMLKNNYLLCLDNVDSKVAHNFLDAIAKCSTGAEISFRKLYTNDMEHKIVPRCFIGVTTRSNPLNRDDVAERTLLFNVKHINDNQRKSERFMMNEIIEQRNMIWSEILINLNALIKSIKKTYDKESRQSTITRMADFEVFCRAAIESKKSSALDNILRKMKRRQAETALVDDYFFQVIDEMAMNNNGEIYCCMERDALYNAFIEYLNTSLDFDVRQIKHLPTRRGFVQYLKNRTTDYMRLFEVYQMSTDRKPLIALYYISEFKKTPSIYRNKVAIKIKNAMRRSEIVPLDTKIVS